MGHGLIGPVENAALCGPGGISGWHSRLRSGGVSQWAGGRAASFRAWRGRRDGGSARHYSGHAIRASGNTADGGHLLVISVSPFLAPLAGAQLMQVAGSVMIILVGPFLNGSVMPMLARVALCAILAFALSRVLPGQTASAAA